MSNNSCVFAAGIGNRGMMTVLNSTITGNTAANSGAGIFNYGGTLTVTNSTISNNSGHGGALGGGGITNLTNGAHVAVLTLIGDTITGNSGVNTGGGVENNQGTATLINDTIVGNTAAQGGGIGQRRRVLDDRVENSIIAGNSGTSSNAVSPARLPPTTT